MDDILKMRNCTVHVRNCLDGAGASWCLENNSSSHTYILSAIMTNYPGVIRGYDNVYLFGTNLDFENINFICSNNRTVHMFSKLKKAKVIDNWESKPINFIFTKLKIDDSYIQVLCYKFKIQTPPITDHIISIDRNIEYPNCEYISEYMRLALPYDFKTFRDINHMIEFDYDAAVNLGKGIKLGADHARKILTEKAKNIIFNNIEALIINCTVDFYKTAELLAVKSPGGVGVTWRSIHPGTYHFSIASTLNSGIDSSKLVKRYGGSGSVTSAGFRLDSDRDFKNIMGSVYKRR